MATLPERLAAILQRTHGIFAGDAVCVGELHGGRLHFHPSPPDEGSALWDLIRQAAASGGSAEGTLPSGGTAALRALNDRDRVTGVLLVSRPEGGFTDVERVVIDLIADRLAETIAATDSYARLDELFRQYMPDDVASALVGDATQAQLGGTIRTVSLLFADIEGFTSHSEHTAPDQVVAMLNHYFGLTVPLVIRNGGTVTAFLGDAMMAMFNAPADQPEHPLLAARAALAVQETIEAEAARSPGWPRFRVGVSTGPALVGNIGSTQRRTYTAIGDTVNLAARLQTLAEPGQVVIGENTARSLGPVAVTHPLGAVPVKGKREPVQAYVLESLRPDSGPLTGQTTAIVVPRDPTTT